MRAADLRAFAPAQKMGYGARWAETSIGLTDKTRIQNAQALWQLRVWYLATWIFALPLRLAWRVSHKRMGADPQRFGERLGRPSSTAEGPAIWIHAASLGEVAQIGPLVRHFVKDRATVLVTTTTQAGADWVAQQLPDALHQFLPLDTRAAVNAFLNGWEMRAAIFVEGDFAPRLTLGSQERRIPMALLNARHSRTRDRLPTVFGALLAGFALITCRSEAVARKIEACGVSPDRIKVLPDLRIAATRLPCPADVVAALTAEIGARPVWLAASTHPDDEAAVLAAHAAVLRSSPGSLLIVAPRHPKRGGPLTRAARSQGFDVAQRTAGETLSPDTQIYVADTLGELGVFLSLAPITFLGGSFGDEGGHNPYEPASFGTAILTGPRVKNFAEAFDALRQAGAAEIIEDPNALGPCVVSLLQTDQAQTMGAAAKSFFEASEASMDDTISALKSALEI